MVAGVSALPGNGQRPQAKAAGKLKDSSLTSRTDSRTRGAPPGATGGFPETWPPGSLGCVFPLPQQPGAPPHLQPLLQPPPPTWLPCLLQRQHLSATRCANLATHCPPACLWLEGWGCPCSASGHPPTSQGPGSCHSPILAHT